MRKEITVGFYTGESVGIKVVEDMKDCDAALFSVKELSQVRIKDELDGKSNLLLKMGAISKRIKGACFFSVYTDTYGVMRNSIACFSLGKLVAIADLNSSESKAISPSFGLKSVRYGGVKYGVLVGSDILDTAALHSLALTENDVIINLSAAVFDFDNEKLISSLAFLFGVPIVSVGQNKKVIAKANGEVIYSANGGFAVCGLPLKKSYKERFIKILGS